MVKSMTGFGQITKKHGETQLSIEIKTVNHRFLDMNFKMSKPLSIFEEKMRKIIQQYIKRGRVDVFVTLQGQSLTEQHIQVNWNLLNQYLEQFNEIQIQKQIKGDIQINDLIHLNDLFQVEETNDKDEQFEQFLMTAFHEVLNGVNVMRIEEGSSLKEDILSRLKIIDHITNHLYNYADEYKEQYRQKIIERIKEYLNDVVDESRIIQEAAILSEKSDISEEIIRLNSHIEQFNEIIEKDDAIGRKLDFLTQELLREVNTIGSKANDVRISKYVVELKSEIEKIKEQVQNIE